MAAEKLDTETRREQIAQAALEMLGTHSVQELSMADIARRVGIVPSAIYRHFSGKEEVLDAVVDLIRRRLLDNVQQVRQEGRSHLETLHRLVMRHVELVRKNQAIPRIMLSAEITSGSTARKQKGYELISAYLDQVIAIIRTGQQQGEIRTDVKAETVAIQMLGIVQPGAVLWQLSDGRFDVTRHARRAWQLLEAAIRIS